MNYHKARVNLLIANLSGRPKEFYTSLVDRLPKGDYQSSQHCYYSDKVECENNPHNKVIIMMEVSSLFSDDTSRVEDTKKALYGILDTIYKAGALVYDINVSIIDDACQREHKKFIIIDSILELYNNGIYRGFQLYCCEPDADVSNWREINSETIN